MTADYIQQKEPEVVEEKPIQQTVSAATIMTSPVKSAAFEVKSLLSSPPPAAAAASLPRVLSPTAGIQSISESPKKDVEHSTPEKAVAAKTTPEKPTASSDEAAKVAGSPVLARTPSMPTQAAKPEVASPTSAVKHEDAAPVTAVQAQRTEVASPIAKSPATAAQASKADDASAAAPIGASPEKQEVVQAVAVQPEVKEEAPQEVGSKMDTEEQKPDAEGSTAQDGIVQPSDAEAAMEHEECKFKLSSLHLSMPLPCLAIYI